MSFELIDATINDIHNAYANGSLTSVNLVEAYFERIEKIDRNGPKINSIITINPSALDEAKRLDKAYDDSGLIGSLHGIPIVFKDQGDVDNMPTTLGSILFEKYQPRRDCTARWRKVARLRVNVVRCKIAKI